MTIDEIKEWADRLRNNGISGHNIERIDWLISEVDRLTLAGATAYDRAAKSVSADIRSATITRCARAVEQVATTFVYATAAEAKAATDAKERAVKETLALLGMIQISQK